MSRAYRDRVADLFRSKPNTWIDGMTLAQTGGQYAWRSRISDCRTELGMNIENQIRRLPGGRKVSEYRFVPASEPRQANLLERAS